MTTRQIPAAVLADQQRAADPAASAWVSANAGSGKTHVLAQRVIHLLLQETDPAKILCLTFTKAAAANMANRVFSELAKWTSLDDAELDQAMRRVGARQIGPVQRALARRLFASVLETPGGLKVQTIHAFCTRLLQQFPFEANVAARFRVLEETQRTQMLEDLRMRVLMEAATHPNSPAGRALTTVITAASDYGFKTALTEAIREQDKIMAWLSATGGVENAGHALSRALGIDPQETAESLNDAFLASRLIPIDEWPALIEALSRGGASDREHVGRLEQAGAASGERRLKAYLSMFCTKDLSPRKNLVTKAIRDRHPELCQRLMDEQARLCGLIERRRAVTIRDRTVALLTLSKQIIELYGAEKGRRGLLDYDDLIGHTRALLSRVESAWVHYKLDLGIDHLLIDEAQDTSPEQWDIIRHLVSEFTAGAGARGALRRTIFAVGDEKQSIFSFQGAAPQQFDEMRRDFRTTFQSAEMEWRDLRLGHSFRSGESVLDAVHHVFGPQAIFRSVTSDQDGLSAHVALPEAAPGLVDIWPLVEPDPTDKVEAWDAPFDKTSETSPPVKLANRIAQAVRAWRTRDVVGEGSSSRPVRPGDILILVRQRGALFEAIIRALKNAGIAVAGADRLVLTDHIAIMDLMALADALLLPEDDLALATILKSPLFGLSEDDLFALAWNRKGSLRAALRMQRPELAARLDELDEAARALSPFAFYARLLGGKDARGHSGRKRFLARLGHEANDALDEFLNLALDYESRETPSLQGFVAWLRTAFVEVKRDMEIARDEVRVMTVHGAKGLEAPIVILADTTTQPEGPAHFQPRLLSVPAADAKSGAPECIAWMPRKEDDTAVITAARNAAKQAAEDEYRRLLYVAMTRAAERLVVCGSIGIKKMPPGCWYDLIDKGLQASMALTEAPADAGDGTILRFRKRRPEDGAPHGAVAAAPPPAPALAPWLRANAPLVPPASVTRTPSSDEAGDMVRRGASAEARATALRRGVLVHRLMQSLPDVAAQHRAAAADNYLALAARAAPLADDERAALLAQVFAVLDDSRFAPLFAPGSRAEVPVVGRVPGATNPTILVSGQIDRLAITDEAVLIADYKTNRDPPRRIEDAPASYLRQLALYRAVLAQVYPGRAIRAALLWTDVPDLMEVSPQVLDTALAAALAEK